MAVSHDEVRHETARSAARNPVLDGLRAVAIARVITWHATGWEWATWVVSAVPAMFMLTGALIYSSAARSPLTTVVRARASRLAGPLWFYGLVVMILAWAGGETIRPGMAWRFLLPVLTPEATVASGWFTSAMWYLRAYVWVLILAPVLLLVARRAPRSGLSLSILAVLCVSAFGLDMGPRRWMVGDILLYGTCALAGMVCLVKTWPTARQCTAVSIASLGAIVAWSILRWPDGSVVNNDHGLHLLVGIFWCAVLLRVPTMLTRAARSTVGSFLNSRPLTIYLWHSMVAWVFWRYLPNDLGAARPATVLVGTLAALPLVTRAVGAVENRDALRRPVSLLPNLAVLLLAGALAAGGNGRAILEPTVEISGLPLAPSQAPVPVTIVVDREVQNFLDRADSTAPTQQETLSAMADLVRRYDRSMKLNGLRAVVTTSGGEEWITESGSMPARDARTNIGSITKTFTTTIVFQMIREGRISIDEAVGGLGIGFGHPHITVRQLLSHTSGVARYDNRDTGMDRGNGVTPRDVLEWAGARPLEFVPGSRVVYSSTGFVVLGALIEEVSGRSFEEELRDRITGPLALDVETFRAKHASAGFSTGGVSISAPHLARWGREYLLERTLVEPPWKWSIRQTTGLGVHGYCPCSGKTFMALGHMGGRTLLTADGDGTVVVLDSRGVLVGTNYRQTQKLAQELRLLAGGGRTPLYRGRD